MVTLCISYSYAYSKTIRIVRPQALLLGATLALLDCFTVQPKFRGGG